MVLVPINCPKCKSINVTKFGASSVGTQRCRCKDCQKSFQTEYAYEACGPPARSKICFLAINGNGAGATARALKTGSGWHGGIHIEKL